MPTLLSYSVPSFYKEASNNRITSRITATGSDNILLTMLWQYNYYIWGEDMSLTNLN
jgi:hypothetical protein